MHRQLGYVHTYIHTYIHTYSIYIHTWTARHGHSPIVRVCARHMRSRSSRYPPSLRGEEGEQTLERETGICFRTCATVYTGKKVGFEPPLPSPSEFTVRRGGGTFNRRHRYNIEHTVRS